ncbi:MAG TPA: cysteine desulfurase-like protein [Steroidobacteraceae bacterium]|nr:cysteine desulfurase-like protein [Steroidobacteraceae bacterium]
MNPHSSSTVFDADTCERCRRDFPSLRRVLNGHPIAFLDGPGGTQVPNAVIEAIADSYRFRNVNTHGNFAPSAELDEKLLQVRAAVADFLGAAGGERISIGQNMTTLAFSLARAIGRALRAGDEILITQLDHEANRGPWLKLQQLGAVVREIPLLPTGQLDYAAMRDLITSRTRLVAFGCSSNAIGTVNDLHTARRLTREAGAMLVLDAVHYAPHFPVAVDELDPDFLLCSAYKFYGPHVGILYSRPGTLEALDTDRIVVQEEVAPYRIETGTLNGAAIEGVGAAIEYLAGFGRGASRRETVHDAIGAIGRYEHELGRFLWESLREIRGITLWGVDFSHTPRAPTVSFNLQGVNSAAIARALGEVGICVWDGDFYAPSPVRVLRAADGSMLRVGFSMYNTRGEAERLVKVVAALARGSGG